MSCRGKYGQDDQDERNHHRNYDERSIRSKDQVMAVVAREKSLFSLILVSFPLAKLQHLKLYYAEKMCGSRSLKFS